MDYSRRCADASAVRAYQKRGLPLAPGMEIGCMVRDSAEYEVDPDGEASELDAMYYRSCRKSVWV